MNYSWKHFVVVPALLMFTGLVGCGSNKSSNSPNPPAPPANDFALTVTPATVSLAAAGPGQALSVLAAASGPFNSQVSVAMTGLPAGVTSTPTTLTLTPGTAQNVILSAAASASAASVTLTLTGTSGSLVHTASTALTVVAAPAPPPPPPSPDFALSIQPGAATLTAGNLTGPSIAVSAVPLNGFTGTVTVSLSGLPQAVTATPATLKLAPGTPQSIALAAGATAASATNTVTVTGVSGALTHTTTLALTVSPDPVTDVTTYHYDNTRQGQDTNEPILTLTNVNATSFGKVGFYATDGKVDAQPLFAANVALSATDAENLVYVVSEHGTVYAFSTATGQPVWKTSILAAGESPSDDHGCDQITPEIGITSTPVIDRQHGPNGTIFVVGMSKAGSSGPYHQRLHALDLATGAELAGSPTEIAGTFPGKGDNSKNGVVTFDPAQYAERAGLLLSNGTIYLAWTSHCDDRPYTGWVMGYAESTLQQTSVLNLTPNGNEGAIWMAGYGLAADTTGNIYFLDANGTFSGNFDANGFPSDGDYGNAMLKLSTAGNTLAVADFFQPYNTINESGLDEDLGSGGAMLLPDLKDATGTVRHLVVGAGKDDNIYIADRDNMGRFNNGGTDNSNLYQELNDALQQGAWSGPAYFNNTVYYAGQADSLKAFPITNARLASTPSSMSATRFAYPGTTPVVSANGTNNGIVWAVEDNVGSAAVLHAYDARNLTTELYNSKQAAAGRDAYGNGNKFMTPMVANGNVFVGTPTGVAVFGLLGTP